MDIELKRTKLHKELICQFLIDFLNLASSFDYLDESGVSHFKQLEFVLRILSISDLETAYLIISDAHLEDSHSYVYAHVCDLIGEALNE